MEDTLLTERDGSSNPLLRAKILKQQKMYSSYMIVDNGEARGIEKDGSGNLLSDTELI